MRAPLMLAMPLSSECGGIPHGHSFIRWRLQPARLARAVKGLLKGFTSRWCPRATNFETSRLAVGQALSLAVGEDLRRVGAYVPLHAG